MKDEKSEAVGKEPESKLFIKKIFGEKSISSAIVIFCIVTLCLLLGFSKETIEKYEYAIIKKGQELFGIQEKSPCSEGWTFYKQDVIGLSFCYPAEWGNATISPKESVTRLDGLLDEFTSDNNAYHNSFFIGFGKNEKITLRLFNEDYGGEKYPNSYAEKFGYMDNIAKLKASGDICDYKMDFNHTWEYEGRVNEIYASCGENTKTAIIDMQEYFDKEVHSDDLKSFAYKKLQNGYFDNVLLIYNYGSTSQLEQKFDEPDLLLSNIKKDKVAFEKEKIDFEAFVKSFAAFVPEKKVQAAFETPMGEDTRITTIRRYYYLLEGGKLEEAYAMKAEEGKGAYEDFLSQYKNLYIASPYDFKNVGGDEFYFLVRYQDHNNPETKYGVKIVVSGGNLKTTFVEEFKGGNVNFGDYTAVAVKRSGKIYLILKKGETETIVDQGDAEYDANFSNIGTVKSFPIIKFSQSGNYLLYTAGGYEWSSSYAYDIQNAKALGNFLGTDVDNGFGLTPDEKYLYVCRSGGFDSILPGEVYKFPSMEKVFDAAPSNEAYVDTACRYDAGQKAIIFTLSSPYPEDIEPKSKEVRYEVGE